MNQQHEEQVTYSDDADITEIVIVALPGHPYQSKKDNDDDSAMTMNELFEYLVNEMDNLGIHTSVHLRTRKRGN